MKMTHRWLNRVSHLKVPVKNTFDQAFPIVQGSCYKDLRQQSAEYIANSNQVETPLEDFQLGNLQKKCML
jgi:queuine tRNA-ribosyltransferase